MAVRVLIVQSDSKAAKTLARYFKGRGDQVWEAADLGNARAAFLQAKPQLVLLDLHFPRDPWLDFLRRIQKDPNGVRIIATNQYPDVQQEMVARANGVTVFLRQPYTPHWIETALRRLEGVDVPTQPTTKKAAAPAAGKAPKVRMPVRIKITLPYLLLALLFALGAGYIISQVVYESVQDRYFNQLVATGRQTTDWMVREEDRILGTLRLVSNTQGVADAIRAGDAETLRNFVLPLMVNAKEEVVELLDMNGVSVLSIRQQPGGGPSDYNFSRGETFFQQTEFVLRVLQGQTDVRGDKFAGFAQAPWGNYFYVSGPVYDNANQQVGVVLVGKSLDNMVREMRQETLGETTIYDFSGNPLASTLNTQLAQNPIDPGQANEVLVTQEQSSLTRSLKISSLDYLELLGPWEARDQVDLGILGIALPQTFLVTTSQFTRVQIFILIFIAIALVVGIGLYLANLITRPLERLVGASNEVSRGNLGIKVPVEGNDEVAVLAHSFNAMIAGLQEGSMYRDLLGRTVSPEVREQLRQTFSTGNVRLEGQEAVATVLMTDVRSFTTMSEAVEPARVMAWLNEYFDRLVPIIIKHGGVVNKFDGDAILAFFGILPRIINPSKSARAACQAALEMLDAIEQLNQARIDRGDPPFVTGIGVNTGVVIAGGLGAKDRLHYTIIGDTVNTTQRLEALTRQTFDGTGILIGQPTFNALGEGQKEFALQPLGQFTVKGKADKVMVYRLSKAGTSAPAGTTL